MEILNSLPSIFSQLQYNNINVDTNIKGCIHIGAHEGQEYPIYKRFGIQNLLFYEPLAKNFEGLKKSVGPEVDLRNKALGNTTGKIEMFLEDRGLSSSILEPAHHLEQYPQITFDEKEEVDIVKLDDEEFDRSLFNFMNIDVQGYELEVLKGAAETLYSIDLIISEVNRAEMYKDCPKIEEIDDYLSQFGFMKICEYWQLDGGTWGDALYMKRQSNQGLF
tara:strand:- start:230 stop:889 length:660 start_codon:yes stop_codon:yes gene_type:complete